MKQDAKEFYQKLERRENGCKVFTGHNMQFYGVNAKRFAWKLKGNDITAAETLICTCENDRCIEPNHHEKVLIEDLKRENYVKQQNNIVLKKQGRDPLVGDERINEIREAGRMVIAERGQERGYIAKIMELLDLEKTQQNYNLVYQTLIGRRYSDVRNADGTSYTPIIEAEKKEKSIAIPDKPKAIEKPVAPQVDAKDKVIAKLEAKVRELEGMVAQRDAAIAKFVLSQQ